MNSTVNFQEAPNKEEEEEEEALSLSDFPQNSDGPEKKDSPKTYHHRRSSSQPPDSFEFLNDLKSENISHAEDIISGGRLIPYRQQPLFDEPILKFVSEDYDSIDLSRRYCDSLPEIDPKRSISSASKSLSRSSRSLDSGKLRRNSSLVMKSEASDIRRSLSKGSVFKGSKPRWYSLMFGSVKFPPEMDLRDMKHRQVRLIPGSTVAAEEGEGKAPANRRSSWGDDLLRVLSCKNHPSVAVTSSIGLVPANSDFIK